MGNWCQVAALLPARLCHHPLISILIIWGVVYLPLALGISLAYPENTQEMVFDEAAAVTQTPNQTCYDLPSTTATACWTRNATGQYFQIRAPDNHIPECLELEGYGKLYSAAPYQQNRTWALPSSATSFIAGTGKPPTWLITITEKQTDVLFYRDRGATLLEGKLLYRDVPTLTPPMINLFWLLPVALGGSFFLFRLYFAAFALMVAMVVLRWQAGKKTAAVVPALFMLCNPLTLHSTLFGIQDDIIITLLIGIAIWAILRLRMNWGAAGIGIGMACKMWPVLLIPTLLVGRDSWVKKIGRIAGACGIMAASLLPFYLLASDNVLRFLRLYVTGDSGGTLQGISLWRYAGQFGLNPFLALPILCIGGVGLLFLIMRWQAPPLTAGGLFILLFLLLYPKIHSGYYLFLLLFIALFWERGHVAWAGLGISIGAVLLDVCNGLGWTSSSAAAIPLLVAGVLWLLLASLFTQTVKSVITIQQGAVHTPLALTDTSPQTVQDLRQEAP
jgi:hypothetical protein